MRFEKLMPYRKIREGDLMFRFYGIAWSNPELRVWTCYPIPFNFLARWVRDLYWLLMGGSKREDLREAAYNAGVEEGRKREKLAFSLDFSSVKSKWSPFLR